MKRLLIPLLLSILAACSSNPSRDAAPQDYFDHSKIGDAVPRHEPRSRYGNPRSYVVFGKTYHVMSDDAAIEFSEEGMASWYGTKFHGNRTSSGEPYDMYQMTAAHKTLPLPSYVRVRNLANGKSVIVRVNDRGPFHDGRIIDLSYAAALKLGVVSMGTARVRIETIDTRPGHETVDNESGQPSAAPVTEDISSAWYIQLGAFGERANAEKLQSTLAAAGLANTQIQQDAGRALHRVRLGPFASEAEANDAAIRLAAIGQTNFHIIRP